MRNSTKLSAIAVLAAMLSAGPVMAATINLGGNGGLLDLGGNGGNSNTTVDATLGGTDADANVTVNGSGTNGLLGGNGLLGTDVFGSSQHTTADANLDNAGDANVDLFGGDGDSNADVTLGNGNTNILDDLFGIGGVGGAGDNGDGTTTADVNLGLGNLLGGDDLFGNPLPTPQGNGGTPGGGNPGTGGGVFGPGGSGNGAGVEVAALEDGAACFNPDAGQMGKLINRHAYTATSMGAWRGVTELKIVKIELCASAKSEIGASTNVAALQAYLAANPTFSARLQSKGYSPDDVIAVDRNGKTLIVYVS